MDFKVYPPTRQYGKSITQKLHERQSELMFQLAIREQTVQIWTSDKVRGLHCDLIAIDDLYTDTVPPKPKVFNPDEIQHKSLLFSDAMNAIPKPEEN